MNKTIKEYIQLLNSIKTTTINDSITGQQITIDNYPAITIKQRVRV